MLLASLHLTNDDPCCVLQDSSFSANHAATSQGGALSVAAGSSASISNTTFVNNVAAQGGAIYALQASVTLQGCAFSFNAAGTAGTSVQEHAHVSVRNVHA